MRLNMRALQASDWPQGTTKRSLLRPSMPQLGGAWSCHERVTPCTAQLRVVYRDPLHRSSGGFMHVRATAATAALLLAALTACGGGGDKADPKHPDRATNSSAEKVDCKDTSLSQADWTKYCSKAGAGTGGDGTAGTTTLAFGKAAKTVGAQSPADGSQGGEMLEVSPTTVVYQAEAMGSEAQNGVYAIITVKDRAPSGSAAESAPIEGGGWQWIAPDGQALDEGENEASSITPDGFTGGGSIPAGAYKWRTIAFDLSKAQAKGGTIVYTDGAAGTYRWKVPATDSGPELAQLKKGMAGNY